MTILPDMIEQRTQQIIPIQPLYQNFEERTQ